MEESFHSKLRPKAPMNPIMQPQGVENAVSPKHVPYPSSWFRPSGMNNQPEAPAKPVIQPQGVENAVPPECIPYPPGWFRPPGMDPCFHRYPGFPFFGSYGGWGMMDPSGTGPSALFAGAVTICLLANGVFLFSLYCHTHILFSMYSYDWIYCLLLFDSSNISFIFL